MTLPQLPPAKDSTGRFLPDRRIIAVTTADGTPGAPGGSNVAVYTTPSPTTPVTYPLISDSEGAFAGYSRSNTVWVYFHEDDDVVDNPVQVDLIAGADVGTVVDAMDFQLEYQGTWDASSNTPTLSDVTGTAGDVYRISVDGTQDLGSGSQDWVAGALAVHNEGVWEQRAGVGTVALLDVDTDIAMVANSDTRVASQKATKAYVDGRWQSGTHAARLAIASPVAGQAFYETDTNILYRYSGSAWVAQGSGFVHKAALQTLTQSTTTLQNVTSLAFPIEVNERWWFRLVALVTGASTAADIQFAWTNPTGATGEWQTLTNASGAAAAATPSQVTALTTAKSYGLTAGKSMMQAVGEITADATHNGTVQLQAAQNNSTAEDVTIGAGSWIELRRLV